MERYPPSRPLYKAGRRRLHRSSSFLRLLPCAATLLAHRHYRHGSEERHQGPDPVRKKAVNPLFEKWPKQFGIRGALQAKRDLHCFVKCPKVQCGTKYTHSSYGSHRPYWARMSQSDNNTKYQTKDKAAKKEMLLKEAQKEAEGKTVEVKKTVAVKQTSMTKLMRPGKNRVAISLAQSHMARPKLRKSFSLRKVAQRMT
uniref:Uncharacterized protein n=1 Tax=Oryza brachyantha TaxID=4533 RepID=J3L7C2_ORYBR